MRKCCPVTVSQTPQAMVQKRHIEIRTKTIPRIRRLSSLSRLVLLKMVLPVFCINFVSFPAKTTIPKAHFVLRRTHPLNNILSLSIGYSCPLMMRFPSNLVKLLFGASHLISPRNLERSWMSSWRSIVSVKVWRHFKFVSLMKKNRRIFLEFNSKCKFKWLSHPSSSAVSM